MKNGPFETNIYDLLIIYLTDVLLKHFLCCKVGEWSHKVALK